MITNSSASISMNSLFSGTKYLALMNADPTQSGLFTNEMAGEGYVRKPITFSNASGRTVSNTIKAWWTDLPNTPIRYVAVCSAVSGGTMVAYQATGSDIYVPEGQRYVIGIGDLAFTLN